jgi:glucose-6-phosphate 1-dehydrogenase
VAHAGSAKATSPHADALVIFGITGDLAKKMTF